MSPDVTVIDQVPYSAAVTPAQALAYVRRVLQPPLWRERTVQALACSVHVFEPSDGSAGCVEVAAVAVGDWSSRMREACEELAALGIVARPSDALRGMVAVGEVIL